MSSQHAVGIVVTVGVELFVLLAAGVVCLIATRAVAGQWASLRHADDGERVRALRVRMRRTVIVATLLLLLVILTFNAWLVAHGTDVPAYTLSLVRAITLDSWKTLAVAIVKLTAGAALLTIASRVVRSLLASLERAVNAWDRIKDNDRSLGSLFSGLHRTFVNLGRMLLAVYALRLLSVPDDIVAALLTAVRLYLIVAVGVLIVRSSLVIVDTLDGWSRDFAANRGWHHYYEHLRPLVPTFRACLEYVLWIGLVSLLILQFERVGALAVWGPKLIEAIGLLFLAVVAKELGRLEIDHRLLSPPQELDDMARRRRATMAPLVRTGFTYAVYFAAAVLILASLGFNPLPFLAGAGILGLVVGFGAQSLINDVVSGFFMLFENTYLVGDTVEIGSARGVIEGIDFRTTKIRDRDGRLHILRNGDVKIVINASKEYAMAVVPIDVTYDADLATVFSILRDAGARLQAEEPDVLGDTEIEGIVAFGPNAMTIRTMTKVKPGRHDAVAAALRLLIKEGFDRRAAGALRKGLVPAELVGPPAR
jgi:small conductance mechanosensitive channel